MKPMNDNHEDHRECACGGVLFYCTVIGLMCELCGKPLSEEQ